MVDLLNIISKIPIINKIFKSEIKEEVSYNSSYGGSYGGSHSGGAKWPSGLSGDGVGISIDHYRMRQNARLAYHEVPQARALVDRYADTVVDCGLKLEAAPKFEILGITPEQAEKWSREIEEKFDSWAQSKKSYRAETMTFYQSQRLYEIYQQRDNDIFVSFSYSNRRDLLNPLQVSFIDTNQIRGDAFTFSYGPFSTNDGIIRNGAGKEIGYKIWIKKKTGKNEYAYEYEEKIIPAKGAKSGRTFMIHGFNPEYAHQSRGYSRLGHAIQDFQNIVDFTSSQIKKAINQSSMVMAVENELNDPSNPMEGILTDNGAGPIGEVSATSETPEGEVLSGNDRVNYCPIPEATITDPGSTGIFNLTKGDKIKMLDQTAPSDGFQSFVDAFTSYLSAANSMPLEVLLMKFNQNYSASRGALILFWRVAQIWRDEMAADYLDPVYESWLSEEIAAGRIKAPGWSDPRLRQAWLNNNWIGAPMPNIDPKKTFEADKGYVEMGAQTLDRVARNFNGSSGKMNRSKIAREFKELPESPFQKKQGAQ